MKRRDFIVGLVFAAIAPVARAQAPMRQVRIAIAHSGIPADQLSETGGTFWIREFFRELRRLGYAEGSNLTVERYSTEGHYDRFQDLARTVVARRPELIVTHGPLVNAFRTATGTLPIIAILGDPVRQGQVNSLARPGANVTGVSVDADVGMYAKQLQILTEAVPSAHKIAYLGSQASWEIAPAQEEREGAGWKAPIGLVLREAAPRLGVSLIGAAVADATPTQIRQAFAEIAKQRADAIIVSPEGEFLANRQLIAELADANRVPAMYPYRDFVEIGGFISYGPDLGELARHLAGEALQVLGGAKPGDIPVYQATKFELLLNLKAAKALGLAIPQSLLTRADEVIE